MLAYIKSKEFVETIFTELQNMWSNQISEVFDYMMEVRDDIPLFRIFEIVGNNGYLGVYTKIFVDCLQDQITRVYSKNMPTSNWDLYVFLCVCFAMLSTDIKKSTTIKYVIEPRSRRRTYETQ